MRFIDWVSAVKRCAELAKYDESSPYYAMAMRYIRRVRDRLMRLAECYGDKDYRMLYSITTQMSCRVSYKHRTELYREYFERGENVQ